MLQLTMSKDDKVIHVQEQLDIQVKISKDAKSVSIKIKGDEPITLDDIEAVLIHIIEMSMDVKDNLDHH